MKLITPEATQAVSRPSSRLPGVDGLRALAAMWVVFFHIHAFSQARFAHVPGLDLFLRSGSTGVSLFLVLSGFCLYIPFAGGRTDRFRTGQFLWRRCRRLMPAYYVSLALVLVLNLGLGVWFGFDTLSLPQAFWQTVTHASMIHTLFPSTFYALNGAYWSLGLEWQLYLSLPLLVWGVRHFGLTRTVLSVVLFNVAYAMALQVIIHQGLLATNSVLATVVLPNQLPGRWAEFALGMVAAELYATGQIKPWALRAKWIIPVFLPVSIAISGWSLCHIVYGVVFFSLLSLVLASDNVISTATSWSPVVAIGTMSYSLYLVHQPLVQGISRGLRMHSHASPQQTFLALVALIPLILFVAWVLFYMVERHTMTSGRSVPAHPVGESNITPRLTGGPSHHEAQPGPGLVVPLPARRNPSPEGVGRGGADAVSAADGERGRLLAANDAAISRALRE